MHVAASYEWKAVEATGTYITWLQRNSAYRFDGYIACVSRVCKQRNECDF